MNSQPATHLLAEAEGKAMLDDSCVRVHEPRNLQSAHSDTHYTIGEYGREERGDVRLKYIDACICTLLSDTAYFCL